MRLRSETRLPGEAESEFKLCVVIMDDDCSVGGKQNAL
jgi:hypothetical protein